MMKIFQKSQRQRVWQTEASMRAEAGICAGEEASVALRGGAEAGII